MLTTGASFGKNQWIDHIGVLLQLTNNLQVQTAQRSGVASHGNLCTFFYSIVDIKTAYNFISSLLILSPSFLAALGCT